MPSGTGGLLVSCLHCGDVGALRGTRSEQFPVAQCWFDAEIVKCHMIVLDMKTLRFYEFVFSSAEC